MRTHGIHSKYPPLVAGHPSLTPPFDFSHFSSIDKTKERTQALFSLLHPTDPAAPRENLPCVISSLLPQSHARVSLAPPLSRNHKLGKGL